MWPNNQKTNCNNSNMISKKILKLKQSSEFSQNENINLIKISNNTDYIFTIFRFSCLSWNENKIVALNTCDLSFLKKHCLFWDYILSEIEK